MINQKIINVDCMEYMRSCDNNQFDLAICDPPYFTDTHKKLIPGNLIKKKLGKNGYGINTQEWNNNVPQNDYYLELCRISKHQIIFGINYFEFSGMAKGGRLIWDKDNESSVFSHCEIASCSIIETVKIFRYRWNGMIQQNMKNKQARIHPTQKPIELYEWILVNFASSDHKIFDSHSGSGSSAIACSNFNFDYVGCEIDSEMHQKSVERLESYKSQLRLFT